MVEVTKGETLSPPRLSLLLSRLYLLLPRLSARPAHAVELYRFAGDEMSVLFVDQRLYPMLEVGRYLDVVDRSAYVANEVVMRFADRLVHVDVATEPKPVHRPLLYKNVQIPIDVSQADRWKLALQIVVEPRCREMTSAIA